MSLRGMPAGGDMPHQTEGALPRVDCDAPVQGAYIAGFRCGASSVEHARCHAGGDWLTRMAAAGLQGWAGSGKAGV